MPQDFLDVLSSIGGIFYGNIKHRYIKAICTDSRECQHGDLFFALKGDKFDGNDFIKNAIDNGAIPVGPSVRTFGIKAHSGNEALLDFAKFYRRRLPKLLYTVAITGSVGKTTAKEFLSKLTSQRYKTHSTWQNLNNGVGVPITVLSAPSDTEVLICELGMNHRGEIKRLSRAVEPDIAVITKIGTAHIGNLGSIEEIARAKLEITNGLSGVLLIPLGEKLLECSFPCVKTHSAESKSATVATLKNQFNLLEIYKNQELLDIIDFQFDGKHLYECLSAAVCAAIHMKMSSSEIMKGIKKIGEDSFRHKIYKTPQDFYILDDSYNASYESVIASIDLLSDLKGYSRKSILLGDILELGDKSAEIHSVIGSIVTKHDIDKLFVIGDFSRYIVQGALSAGFPKNRIFMNPDMHSPEITSSAICQNMRPNEILLIKASHKMNMGRIINLSLGK